MQSCHGGEGSPAVAEIGKSLNRNIGERYDRIYIPRAEEVQSA